MYVLGHQATLGSKRKTFVTALRPESSLETKVLFNTVHLQEPDCVDDEVKITSL